MTCKRFGVLWRELDDIWGIGFKTADQIATKLGFAKESFVRLRSGLMYTLSELSNDGHVYAEKEQFICLRSISRKWALRGSLKNLQPRPRGTGCGKDYPRRGKRAVTIPFPWT